jgi:hypothetical protein
MGRGRLAEVAVVEPEGLVEAQTYDAELDLVIDTAQTLITATGGLCGAAVKEAEARAVDCEDAYADPDERAMMVNFWGDVAASIRDAYAGRI